MAWILVGDYFGVLMNSKTVLQKNHKERHRFFLKQRNKSAALCKQKLHKQLPSKTNCPSRGEKRVQKKRATIKLCCSLCIFGTEAKSLATVFWEL